MGTHVFNALNLLFPDGERFFIRAVNDNLDRIDEKIRKYSAEKPEADEETSGEEEE